MEEACAILYLCPRAENGHDAEEVGEQQHHQAESIDGKVKTNAELRNPLEIAFFKPALRRRRSVAGVGDPYRERRDEVYADAEERDPAGCGCVARGDDP